MELLPVAINYLQKGLSIIPVGIDKKPLVKWQEFQNRLPTLQEVQEWFAPRKKNKDGREVPFFANKEVSGIGVVTGKLSNLSVVDVDVHKGGKTDGLPPTLVSKTQSGGWHYYYRYLEGLPNKADVKQGIDIRSEGGFVIAPPSRGEKGVYKWMLEEEPQPFPVEQFQLEIEEAKLPNDWDAMLQGSQAGSRNQTAAKLAGLLFQKFDPSQWTTMVWQLLLGWNKQNNPPLPEKELRAVFNSIAGREMRKRKGDIEDDVPVVLMSEAAKKFNDGLPMITYPSGFSTLDEVTKGGFSSGNLVILVGATGNGKSTMARSFSANLLDQNIPSVWFTFEMTIAEMWDKFKEMGLKDKDHIYTPETYLNRKLPWLKKKIVEARDVHKCKAVFIDHLGFLVSEYDGGNVSNMSNNLATVYTMICRDLKSIAVQEDVVIILMWHLKKMGFGKKEADLEDIKDSSGVAQEADFVLSIEREKANTQLSNIQDVYSQYSWIKMLKNRRTGINKKFKCIFHNERLREVALGEKIIEEPDEGYYNPEAFGIDF